MLEMRVKAGIQAFYNEHVIRFSQNIHYPGAILHNKARYPDFTTYMLSGFILQRRCYPGSTTIKITPWTQTGTFAPSNPNVSHHRCNIPSPLHPEHIPVDLPQNPSRTLNP